MRLDVVKDPSLDAYFGPELAADMRSSIHAGGDCRACGQPLAAGQKVRLDAATDFVPHVWARHATCPPTTATPMAASMITEMTWTTSGVLIPVGGDRVPETPPRCCCGLEPQRGRLRVPRWYRAVAAKPERLVLVPRLFQARKASLRRTFRSQLDGPMDRERCGFQSVSDRDGIRSRHASPGLRCHQGLGRPHGDRHARRSPRRGCDLSTEVRDVHARRRLHHGLAAGELNRNSTAWREQQRSRPSN